MAPRLSRWVALAVVAGAVVVATSLLNTGGAPLSFLPLSFSGWNGEFQYEGEMTPMQRRIAGVGAALANVRTRRAGVELDEQVAAATARSNADPIVLTRDGDRLVVDRPATAALDSVWRGIPSRRNDIRTIVVPIDRRGYWGNMNTELRPDGSCVVRTYAARAPSDLVVDLRSRAGTCLFSEEFGMPGKGVRRWEDGVRWGLSWDRDRWPYWYRWDDDANDRTFPAWFQREGRLFVGRTDYGWEEKDRLVMACVTGRSEECEAAAGVGAAGHPEVGVMRGSFDLALFPETRLPRDLLRSVGPMKFGEIWTSDEPIAMSYARVTGSPMKGWLAQWATSHAGTIIRDNALSLVGWLGALIWIALLSVLITQRLKQRTVT